VDSGSPVRSTASLTVATRHPVRLPQVGSCRLSIAQIVVSLIELPLSSVSDVASRLWTATRMSHITQLKSRANLAHMPRRVKWHVLFCLPLGTIGGGCGVWTNIELMLLYD